MQYSVGPVTYQLISNGLIDELRLWVHPLILGRDGPVVPHFRESPPVELRLEDASSLTNGIAILRYPVVGSDG